MGNKVSAEETIRDIKRKTRRKYNTEEKIRIVLEGLRGEVSVAELCRREGINQNLYYKWSEYFLEAWNSRLQGDTQRLNPYGELDWCLVLIDAWLERASIKEGAVFRGLYKSGAILRPERLTVLSVQRVLAAYPLVLVGQLVTVKPHDCRRTYARLQYEAGTELVAIQQSLGHASLQSTLGYIGRLDADKRRARGVIHYDLKRV